MRPRRLIPRVLLGAVLGAATTIGIVLWLALRGVDAARRTGIAATTPIALPDPPIAHLFFPHLDGLGWTVLETHSWKLRTDAGEFVQADDPTPGRWNISTRTLRKIDARPDRRRPLHSGWLVQSEFQFGWPFRAAWAIEGLAKDNFLTTAVDEHLLLLRPESRINGPFLNLRAPAGAPRPRSPLALPTGILPLGFAANTTIFGATWLLLFATLSQLRARYRRRRKHLCPHCSDPREGLPANSPCPECGTVSPTHTPKPHPNIRKAVKWGGAAATLTLVAIWIGTGQHYVALTGNGFCVGASQGSLAVHASDELLLKEIPRGWYHGIDAGYCLRAWASLTKNTSGWSFILPLWIPAVATFAASVIAFHLDTLARRRARSGHCPTCSYSRTGLPATAPCPECGTGSPTP